MAEIKIKSFYFRNAETGGKIEVLKQLHWLPDVKDNVTHAQAVEWAVSMNARLPTKEEFEQISERGDQAWKKELSMDAKGPDGYSRWYWSASLAGREFASGLDGYNGIVYDYYRSFDGLGSARCVRDIVVCGLYTNSEELRDKATDALTTWQPMDTAPRDELILIYRKYHSMECAMWSTDDNCWIVTNNTKLLFDPTHWMPLPESPVEPV